MKRSVRSLLGCAVVCGSCGMMMFGGGCGVQQSKYDQLLMANRSLQEQVVTLEDERNGARANLDTLRDQLSRANAELGALQGKYGSMGGDFDRLQGEYDAMLARISSMDFGPLPDDVEQALRELAAQYPEMLTFDAKRGVLRFASDFTFALGSADLNSQAQSTLASLAKILNSASAKNFEVRVIGHTDNVRIARDQTRQQHPTNLHLSAHRAISVRDSLVNAGVAANRFMIGGYSEYRPVVPNPSSGGSAQNRRVEVYLTPMPNTDPMPSTTVVGAEGTSSRSEEPMK